MSTQQSSFDLAELTKMYNFKGKTVAITGGAGVLGSDIVYALTGCGAEVAILDIVSELHPATIERLGERLKQVSVFKCNVLDRESIAKTAEDVMKRLGKLDCLINAAGGNKPTATTSPELKFFDLPADALRWVFELNVMGTILPSQAFGKVMAEQGYGTILNISSMNAFRPLTRIARLLGGQGRGEQLHAVAGRAYGAGVLAEDPGERHCAGILPDRTKPLSVDRQGDGRVDGARQDDRRAHADGAFRRIRGPVRRRAVAAVAGFGVRDRRGDSDRWRFLRVQRRVGNRAEPQFL